jgi:hypothetical protein
MSGRGDMVLIHPIDSVPCGEIYMAVDDPRLLSDTRVIRLLRYQMRSASDPGRVDNCIAPRLRWAW